MVWARYKCISLFWKQFMTAHIAYMSKGRILQRLGAELVKARLLYLANILFSVRRHLFRERKVHCCSYLTGMSERYLGLELDKTLKVMTRILRIILFSTGSQCS